MARPAAASAAAGLAALLVFASFTGPAAAAAATRALLAEDDHDHDHGNGHDDHGEHCACIAAEEGFTIDCSDTSSVDTAVSYLSANSCENVPTDENAEEACHKSFLIVQSHHDFCPHDTLDKSVEGVMHVYEDHYESCQIGRQYDADLSNCPAVTCSDSAALNSAIDTLYASCNTTCTSNECTAAFQMVLTAHDTCDEDDLPGTIEVSLHDFEETCEAALCNSVTEAIDLSAVECDDHDDHGDEGGVGLAAANALPAAALLTLLALRA